MDNSSPRRAKRLVLLYLIFGAAVTVAVMAARPGVYYGLLDGSVELRNADHSITSRVAFQGQTQRAWYWIKPVRHRYSEVTLSVNSSRATITVDLARGTWRSEAGRFGTVDAPSLAGPLFGEPVEKLSDDLLAQAQSMVHMLDQMRDGMLLPARQQSYSLETPVRARYMHFTAGQNWQANILFAWLGVWPLSLVLRKRPVGSRWLRPRKAFAATAVLVIAADLLLAGIGAIVSSGPIAKASEFLANLVNGPAWLVVDNIWTSSMQGRIFSILAWAVLVSAGAVITAPRAHPSTTGRNPVS